MVDWAILKTILIPFPSQNGQLNTDIGKTPLETAPFYQ